MSSEAPLADPRFHRRSEEIYLVLEGQGELGLDGERRTLGPGTPS